MSTFAASSQTEDVQDERKESIGVPQDESCTDERAPVVSEYYLIHIIDYQVEYGGRGMDSRPS
jgi:hypothetical protein